MITPGEGASGNQFVIYAPEGFEFFENCFHPLRATAGLSCKRDQLWMNRPSARIVMDSAIDFSNPIYVYVKTPRHTPSDIDWFIDMAGVEEKFHEEIFRE